MSEHRASIAWKRTSEDFGYDTYNREHVWTFEGGTRVEASSAPDFLGDPAAVDPEEALVASLSSCHMLTFLALCARKRYVVDAYADEAVGFMEKNDAGKLWVSRVVLRPKIAFSGERVPSAEQIDALHERAHHECFIANSVRTDVRVEPAG